MTLRVSEDEWRELEVEGEPPPRPWQDPDVEPIARLSDLLKDLAGWTHIRVVGRPTPKGSIGAIHVGKPPNCRAVAKESSSANLPAWQADIRRAAHMQTVGSTPIPAGFPVAVRIEVLIQRTKAMKPDASLRHTKQPDVDKLARAILDPLTGIAWADDNQVDDLHPTKRYTAVGEAPGAIILYRPTDPTA